MDFDHPLVLFSSLLIGAIGFGVFLYGKREARPKFLFAGLGLCIFPYFIHSALVMWLITAAVGGGLYASSRYE